MRNVKRIWLRLAMIPVFMLALAAAFTQAGERLPESYYVAKYCNGVVEFALPDRTRVDCLTKQHAAEFDFARKWYEAVGQALWYAKSTGRRAKVVLIAGPDDARYVVRAESLITALNAQTDDDPDATMFPVELVVVPR